MLLHVRCCACLFALAACSSVRACRQPVLIDISMPHGPCPDMQCFAVVVRILCVLCSKCVWLGINVGPSFWYIACLSNNAVCEPAWKKYGICVCPCSFGGLFVFMMLCFGTQPVIFLPLALCRCAHRHSALTAHPLILLLILKS